MASTPNEIAIGASGLSGISDKLDAIIYLLNTNNMTAEEISEAASPYAGIQDKFSAIIYLLNAGGGGSGGGVTCGDYGGAEPSFTPSSCAVAVDTSNGQIWWYYNGAWN